MCLNHTRERFALSTDSGCRRALYDNQDRPPLADVRTSRGQSRGRLTYGSNPETCPVRTIQAWIELAALSSGTLFRSINMQGQVQAARLSGIDVARVVKKFALRARPGCYGARGPFATGRTATSAAIAGASVAVDHETDGASQRA
jgi:hypothetical protein